MINSVGAQKQPFDWCNVTNRSFLFDYILGLILLACGFIARSMSVHCAIVGRFFGSVRQQSTMSCRNFESLTFSLTLLMRLSSLIIGNGPPVVISYSNTPNLENNSENFSF